MRTHRTFMAGAINLPVLFGGGIAGGIVILYGSRIVKQEWSTAGNSSSATTPAAASGTAAPVSLSGISTSAGPIANTSVPLTSWNPEQKPIADWIIPILQWASENGWSGTVTSGYRSYSQQSSINASGAFSAPAGESNHETAVYPGGAVDVTNSSQLLQVLKGYTGPEKLVGGVLGAVDPEHFSATGH